MNVISYFHVSLLTTVFIFKFKFKFHVSIIDHTAKLVEFVSSTDDLISQYTTYSN